MTLIRRVVPRNTAISYFEVDIATTFITPKMLRDKPVARMTKLTEIEDSLEWKIKKPNRPSVVIIVPSIIGLCIQSREMGASLYWIKIALLL